jgi:hypothetical protein
MTNGKIFFNDLSQLPVKKDMLNMHIIQYNNIWEGIT